MMTQPIRKLMPGDVIEWSDGERAKVVWVSEDGSRFRVHGLPTLLRAADAFTVVSKRVHVPDRTYPSTLAFQSLSPRMSLALCHSNEGSIVST